MPVVKDYWTEKRRLTIWDFTEQFPDSITVDRYVEHEWTVVDVYINMIVDGCIKKKCMRNRWNARLVSTWKSWRLPRMDVLNLYGIAHMRHVTPANGSESPFAMAAFSLASRLVCIKSLVSSGFTCIRWRCRGLVIWLVLALQLCDQSSICFIGWWMQTLRMKMWLSVRSSITKQHGLLIVEILYRWKG